MELLRIQPSCCLIGWVKPYPRYDEFDWNTYNDAIDRLIDKVRKGDTIQRIVICQRTLE